MDTYDCVARVMIKTSKCGDLLIIDLTIDDDDTVRGTSPLLVVQYSAGITGFALAKSVIKGVGGGVGSSSRKFRGWTPCPA